MAKWNYWVLHFTQHHNRADRVYDSHCDEDSHAEYIPGDPLYVDVHTQHSQCLLELHDLLLDYDLGKDNQ